MAIYKIASLNYMTAGSNRVFLNMDTMLDYELYKPVVLLRNEESYISAAAVSAYGDRGQVSSDWNSVSGFLQDIGTGAGKGTLEYIINNWDDVKDQVSAAILTGMVSDMVSTPLSVLCSDIVTEQREGNWLKTEFLSREFGPSDPAPPINEYTSNAMAASRSSSDILLNERQRYYGELEGGRHMYIRLYPPGTDRENIRKITEFNERRMRVNRTFVLDVNLAKREKTDSEDGVDSGLNVMHVSSDDGAGVVYPMYDMIDVHVKSAEKCGASSLKSFDSVGVTGRREDIYLPQLKTDPIGYCQIQSNAYMLTEATDLEPGMLESSLRAQRHNRDISRSYTVQIKSNGVKTYLYRKTDGVIDVNGVPQSNLAGIKYNNITEFPQNSQINVGYSQGNQYGYIVRGKNAMNSLYNMSLAARGSSISAYGCRDYIGIGQFAGGQLYFKFYDGVTYSGISAGSEAQLERVPEQSGRFPVVPYQKIECAYINQYTSANLHKTRFFSIKMRNTELNQYSDVADSELSDDERCKKHLYGRIMQDIASSVREIVQNLQPAHTQLYKVMFDG